MTDLLGLDVVYWVIILVVALIVVLFLTRGIYLIGQNENGVVTRKMGGKRMPPGQVIARHGEVGVQATMLVPGLYFRMPVIWKVEKVPIIEVGEDQVGMVEAIDGRPLPKGRILGDEVECNQFQDAEKFFDNGGAKGPQIAILRPGKYRINTRAFVVKAGTAARIATGKLGIVTVLDGQPLPSRFLVAPEPTVDRTVNPKARFHNSYQDGQAFIDSGGFRGPQLGTLQAGKYYLNPLLVNVSVVDVYEVPPGFVSVLRSNVGEELQRSDMRPTPVSSDPLFDEEITKQVENLLVTDKARRGILQNPLAPGEYNLNTVAYSAYLVPTSAIMIDWASEEGPAAQVKMSRNPAAPTTSTSNYPYQDASDTEKGSEFFNFGQLEVTSKDGFILEVDVRVVIRILPQNAAFVIARFGSVFNLIQQIIHPLIDAEFRNSAGNRKALDFFQSRIDLQQEALQKARDAFSKYYVECPNLLISWIEVDKSLLETQTNREIAVQQQTQFEQQALAEQKRIDVAKQTAMADKQPEVVQAQLNVTIQENNAKALVAQSEGIRDSTVNKAQGEAQATIAVGEAKARAYQAQTIVLGPDKVALIQVIDRIGQDNVKITPEFLVTGGGSDGGATSLFSAYLATLLSQSKPLDGRPAAQTPAALPAPAPTPAAAASAAPASRGASRTAS